MANNVIMHRRCLHANQLPWKQTKYNRITKAYLTNLLNYSLQNMQNMGLNADTEG